MTTQAMHTQQAAPTCADFSTSSVRVFSECESECEPEHAHSASTVCLLKMPTRLVPVVRGLEGAGDGHIDVGALIRRQLGQLGAQPGQVQGSYLHSGVRKVWNACKTHAHTAGSHGLSRWERCVKSVGLV